MMLNSQNAKQLLSPSLPILNSKFSILITLMIFTISSFLPWISFTSGNGLVTAINPNERVQPITAPISGFVQTWSVKEGSFVRKGDLIATLTDNDPEILERIARELEASKNAAKSAKLAMDTSLINLERQEKLFEQGLTSRKNFEKAKIDYSKLSMEYSKALATQTKVETQFKRQSSQTVLAPRDGTIVRILPGEMGQLIKAGSPLVIFSPKVESMAVELWIDGRDASLVIAGQTAQIQFEGWPSVQIPGWPSLAMNTFPAKVYLVDQASSHLGKFRVLLIPDGPWPSTRILRLGNHARGYIKLADSFVLKEIWRILNGFPAFQDPIKDELNKMLIPKEKKDDSDEGSKKNEKK